MEVPQYPKRDWEVSFNIKSSRRILMFNRAGSIFLSTISASYGSKVTTTKSFGHERIHDVDGLLSAFVSEEMLVFVFLLLHHYNIHDRKCRKILMPGYLTYHLFQKFRAHYQKLNCNSGLAIAKAFSSLYTLIGLWLFQGNISSVSFVFFAVLYSFCYPKFLGAV